jgi:hypothetical protein
MVRLHDPKTGRIVNVDEDQAKDFRDLGFKTVKGAPDPDETSKASQSKSS